MKSFTAIKLIDAIINNPKESRREYMLDLLEAEGKKSSSNFRFKFWEHENHPVILDSDIVFNQKINYLHWNPVTAGFNSQQRLFALAVRAGRTLRQYKGKSKISGARFVSLGYARKTNHTIPKRYVFHHLYLPSMVAAD